METADAPGSVRGVVRDAATDRPIAEALVTAGDFGTTTDIGGSYVLTLLPAGDIGLEVYRRGYVLDSISIATLPGTPVSADVALEPAPRPCCRLGGAWDARFTLDSAGLNSRPARRTLEGPIRFQEAQERSVGGVSRIVAAEGSTALDFAPLLDPDTAAGLERLEGVVFHGDSVAITMLPRFGDWAIELRGRVAGDTVRGDWFQRASCCGAYGTFRLVRGEAPSGGS